MDLSIKFFANTAAAQRSVKQLESQIRHTAQVAKTEGNNINAIFSHMFDVLGGFSLAGLVKQIVEVRGEFQKLEVAFNVLLQSKEKANTLMTQMVETAATTPFSLQDVATGAKQLLAYGVAAENVNDTLIRLGDISAALSIPLGDLVYLYGTTMTQGRLYTRDYVQFLGRGIPLQAELAKVLETTDDQVSQFVKDGKVGFAEINEAIVNMTNNGGLFGGMMKEMSKTFTGQISNIKDQISVIFNELGKTFAEPIDVTLDAIRTMLDNYKLLVSVLGTVVALRGMEKAAVMVTNATTSAALEKELAMLRFLTDEKVKEKNIQAAILEQEAMKANTLKEQIALEQKRLDKVASAADEEVKQAAKAAEEAAKRIPAAEAEVALRRANVEALQREVIAESIKGNATAAEAAQTRLNSEAEALNTAETNLNSAAKEKNAAANRLQEAQSRRATIEINRQTASLTMMQKLTRNAGSVLKQFAGMTGLTALANPLGALLAAMAGVVGMVKIYKSEMKDVPNVHKSIEEEVAGNVKVYKENKILYEKLRVAWKDLAGDLEGKQKFLQDHQMEMSRLGAATSDVTEAEEFFVKNTDAVAQSFDIRAQAAAAAALSAKYYEEAMQAEAEGKSVEDAAWYEKWWHQIKKGVVYTGAIFGGRKALDKAMLRYGDMQYDKNGELHYRGNNKDAQGSMGRHYAAAAEIARKQAEAYAKEEEKLLKQADALFKPDNKFDAGKTKSAEEKGRTAEQIANEMTKANEEWLKAIRARAMEQANALVEMENQLADAQVEAMRDGFSKVQAEQRREHEQNLSDIESDRKDRIKKELEQLQKEFNEREDYLVSKSKDKKGKVHYARKTFDMDKAYEEAVAGNVGAGSYLASIDAASAQFIQNVNDMADKFKTLETDRFNYVVTKILNEHLYEEKEKLNEIYEQYGSYEQKLEAYMVELNKVKNSEGTTSADIAVAQSEYERKVRAMQFDKAKAYGDIMVAFGDLNNLTNNALDSIIANMKTYRDTMLSSLGTDEIKDFNEKLSSLEELRYKRQRDGVKFTSAEVDEMRKLLDIKIKEKESVLDTLNARRKILETEEREAEISLRQHLSKMGYENADTRDVTTLYDDVVGAGTQGSLQDFDKLKELIGNLMNARATLGGVNGEIDVTQNQMKQLGDTAAQVSKGGLANFASFFSEGLSGTSGGGGAAGTIAIIDKIVHGINDNIHSAADCVKEIKDTMDTFGKDTDARTGIGKLSAGMQMFAEASQGATDAWESLKSGNVFGVVKGVVQSFTAWIKGFNRLHDAKIQEDINDINDKIHDLKNSYDDIADLVEKSYSREAAYYIEQQNRKLYEQKRLVEEQIRLETKKRKTDDDALASYNDQLREINKQIKANKEAAIDAIMGEDVKSAIKRFEDAYFNILTEGTNIKKASRNVVTEMIQSMIEESVSQDVSRPMELLREKMNAYWSDKILSKEERNDLNTMASDLMEQIREQYRDAEDIFTDNADSLQGTSGAFGTMSQESADELNGRFAALQIISQENLLVTKEMNGHLFNIDSYCWSISHNMEQLLTQMGIQVECMHKLQKSME